MDNVTKISDHFWILEGNGVRSFLFEGEKEALLVDTGMGKLPVRELAEELTDLPIMLVNTHTDRDHTGCNKDFRPVYMHPAEMDHYKNALAEGCSMEDVLPLWEGDVIDLGRWKFEVVLTPGHTPGSIMLLERSRRMLISGDEIQDGNIFMFGAGRDIYAFQHSLRKVLNLSDAFDTIWASHGSYPLKADIIPGILQGAKDLVEGKLLGEEPSWPMPCRKYSFGVASFLYNFD